MAGAGYKLFNTGDVLTAAQVNTYLQEQTVMVFASSTARTTALSGVLAEGMMSYLQDTNSVEVYNGSSWVNVGNAGDITEVQAGVGISIASGTGPIPVITNSSTDLITTAGDILYGTAADTMARLGIGTAGKVLTVNSGATAPEWATAPTPSYTWTSYTPTYNNFTLGNGTAAFKYLKIDKIVFVYGVLTLGSTSSVTGVIQISVPVTESMTDNVSNALSTYNDASADARYSGTGRIQNGFFAFLVESNSGTYESSNQVTATIPFTWATSDTLGFTAWYEAS